MNRDADLSERVARIEDELAIRQLVLTYGPSADAGLADRAASVWLPEGEYDWDADGTPHQGREAVEAMLLGDGHQGLIRSGVAHFAGPPLIEVDGDRATALTYSLIMRREPDTSRFYLWRVSAARWDLERRSGTWGVRRRVNRLMDETGAGRTLFGDTLAERFEGGPPR